ncbi:MAG: M28 family peptidase [Candidatus Hodarchaeota archaeon]
MPKTKFIVGSENSSNRISLEFNIAGSNLANSFNESFIKTIFDAANLTSYTNYVYHLADTIGPRPYNSDPNGNASDWLRESLESESKGAITTEIFGSYKNVLGKLPGNETSDRLIVVGGHFDTVTASPGADDNASGTAMMLEVARILSQYNWTTEMWFVGFNAEEIGLYGSEEIVQEIKTTNQTLLNAFTADMILYSETAIVHYEPQLSGSWVWPYLMSVMSKIYGTGAVSPVEGIGGPYSDHWPFIERGLNATYVEESNFNYDHWHRSSDIANRSEYRYEVGTEVAAATAAAVAFYLTYPDRILLDIDADGILDLKEISAGTDPSTADTDGDGLSDDDEIQIYRTDPLRNDSDEDGLLDGEEVNIYLTNPLASDSDFDGLSDSEEIITFGTNPLSIDSDNDTLNDALEINTYGSNPLSTDTDNDTLSDADEIKIYGTDPTNPDTDGDGLSDNNDIFKTAAVDIPLFLGAVGLTVFVVLVITYLLLKRNKS